MPRRSASVRKNRSWLHHEAVERISVALDRTKFLVPAYMDRSGLLLTLRKGMARTTATIDFDQCLMAAGVVDNYGRFLGSSPVARQESRRFCPGSSRGSRPFRAGAVRYTIRGGTEAAHMTHRRSTGPWPPSLWSRSAMTPTMDVLPHRSELPPITALRLWRREKNPRL
jgi:hypothetical protein